MAWPAVKQPFTQTAFQPYVAGLVWSSWRPGKIVWHNTAAPSLEQWLKSAREDVREGRIPGTSRINSLEYYFWKLKGWKGAPHLFIAPDFIWVFNPLTAPGTHSPSYNNTALGIEMVGDFSKEDDDSGDGLKVKNNTINATAVLCSTLGLDPAEAILLHKQDPFTTHDCPGKDIAEDKLQMIRAVNDLMSGGEHNPAATAAIIAGVQPPSVPERRGKTITADLNFRRGSGADTEIIGSLPKGTVVTILDEARNETTAWLRVRTPAGYLGWVSGRHVERI